MLIVMGLLVSPFLPGSWLASLKVITGPNFAALFVPVKRFRIDLDKYVKFIF